MFFKSSLIKVIYIVIKFSVVKHADDWRIRSFLCSNFKEHVTIAKPFTFS